MAAFGTTTKAASVYNYIDTRVRAAFPEHPIIWSYTSKMIRSTLEDQGNGTILNPGQALQKLSDQGHKKAVVQSLHFLAGYEFHKLKKETQVTDIDVGLGLPILSSVTDYHKISWQLTQLLQSRPDDEALIVVGHGTNHPSWSGFLALDYFLRDQFDGRLFFGCIEHFPTAEETIVKLIQGGFKKAFLIPFMLVAGRHFQREILGDDPTSWKSLCNNASIIFATSNQGMGMEPVTSELIVDHIQLAISSLLNENPLPGNNFLSSN